MRREWGTIVIAVGLATAATGQSREQQIAEAVLPLPAGLRANAKVIAYESDAKYAVLREGTNDWICEADEPSQGFAVACNHRILFRLFHRMRELLAQGIDENDVDSTITGEMKSGELETPSALMSFELRGRNREDAIPLATVWIPFATAESTGLLTEADSHRPWLMYAGSWAAHIMFPGN